MRSGLVLGLLLLVGCVSSRPCPSRYPANTPRRTFLWDVRGPGGSLVILGTHQAAAADAIPPAALQALAASQVFVSEAPEAGSTTSFDYVQSMLALPPGQSLRRMLGSHDFDILEEHVVPNRDAVDRLRPWVAMSLLIKGVFEFPDHNMASGLAHQAHEHALDFEFLETWTDQTKFLDMVVGVEDLQGAIHDYDNLACGVQREVDAYEVGDASRFIRAELASTQGPSPSRLAKATGIQIRNRVWADKLAAYARSGRRVFVAIGVSNVLGPNGIGKLLIDAGFDFTQR